MYRVSETACGLVVTFLNAILLTGSWAQICSTSLKVYLIILDPPKKWIVVDFPEPVAPNKRIISRFSIYVAASFALFIKFFISFILRGLIIFNIFSNSFSINKYSLF